MKLILASCFLLVLLLAIQIANPQWNGYQRSEASVVSAEQIRVMQNSNQWSDRFVIVDVRGEAEADVSIIPGAITKSEFERDTGKHLDKLVIAYCTVGHRSGLYAQELSTQGWDCYNYKGSILDWCENQLPLITTDGRETNRVHTYSSKYTVAKGYEAIYK